MIDDSGKQLIKEFLKENSIDELRDYLAEKGYNFRSVEEWAETMKLLLREMGVPDNEAATILRDSFED